MASDREIILDLLARFSILLPNSWNFAFYFPNLIRFYLLLGFFPMMYNQMFHMYSLRCSLPPCMLDSPCRCRKLEGGAARPGAKVD